jgi:hypothetical protein
MCDLRWTRHEWRMRWWQAEDRRETRTFEIAGVFGAGGMEDVYRAGYTPGANGCDQGASGILLFRS